MRSRASNPSLPVRTEESARLWQLDGAGTSVRFSKQVAKLKATVIRPGFTGEKENKPKTNKPNQTSSRRTVCVCECTCPSAGMQACAWVCPHRGGPMAPEVPFLCLPFLSLAAAAVPCPLLCVAGRSCQPRGLRDTAWLTQEKQTGRLFFSVTLRNWEKKKKSKQKLPLAVFGSFVSA